MVSNKRERSAGSSNKEGDTTRRKRIYSMDTTGDFTVQVTLRSQSKAKQNDWKPVKTWRQYFTELGQLRHEAEAAGRTPPEHLPSEDTKEENDVQSEKRAQPGSAGGADLDDDELAEFRKLEQMDGFIEKDDAANPNNPLRPTRETCNLAFRLFDRYARLKKTFKEHVVKNGFGIWGDEFDTGGLLLFEYISIQESYRRHGLGRELVEAVLKRTRAKSTNFFAVVAPGWLSAVVDRETPGATNEQIKEAELRHQAIAESFFRALGFRRVGSSAWFALASSAEHPCHSVAADVDFELPNPLPHASSSEMESLFNDSKETEDRAFLIRLQEKLGDSYNPLWHTANSKGDTLLHFSATASKPQTVSWILKMKPDVQQARNDAGDCPGSLGKCIAGFLSPRMRFAPRNKAHYIHHDQSMDIDDIMGTDFLGDFIEMHGEYLRYVPPFVRNNMRTNKFMRQGFANLFSHFAALSRKETPQGLLTEVNIGHHLETHSEWLPHSKNYLARGGTIYAIGSCLFEFAMNEDEIAGDGDPSMPDEDKKKGLENSEAGAKLAAELASLSECRNDLEYGFVSA
ncbi:hypothetical protein BU23DRAFT_662217 [Bimuria novae-zelandiae CBS 107.79]|uniref:N-acetyltransferase domain-containing protein n=1 Tax=Bimuria novae-zelandiae CBS 107.79 TaxID=1447943 RepID=A0A6A5VJV3_9PLEO|nr:hypothetical protein BU23DRAFT_662217 [Bimuria novae-zelandiae CBS 107.79]